MCTRMYIEIDNQELAEIVKAVEQSALQERFAAVSRPVKTGGEIFPTDVVPVAAPDKSGARAVFPMGWGFTLPGKGPLVNARVETAAVKPAFREAWRGHRCAVPVSGYYEWQHYTDASGRKRTGDKYAIHGENAAVTWLCGLYRIEAGLPVFTVLTREPGPALKTIHHRMPLILPGDLVDAWIRPDGRPEELLRYAVTDLPMEKCV